MLWEKMENCRGIIKNKKDCCKFNKYVIRCCSSGIHIETASDDNISLRMGINMKIGIVGAGKVGCSMGKYLEEHGQAVMGYFSKSKKSVEEAATFVHTGAFLTLEELVEACDVIWITTPDDAIAAVWESVRRLLVHDKIICHFSGSLSSDVFSKRDESGVKACSIHPVYAFSDKFTAFQQLNTAMFTMEGDEEALFVMKPLFESMGNKVQVIAPEMKARYHAAAVMASNLMIGLYRMSEKMLMDCGFDEETAEELLRPLVRGNIDKLLASTPQEALTGPVERGDEKTIQKHLPVLTKQERCVYAALSRELVEIAAGKNPEWNYEDIQNMLNRECAKWEE